MKLSPDVEDRQPVIDAFFQAIWGVQNTTETKPLISAPRKATNLTDAQIIDRASNARNGEKFRDLWAGNWQAHYGSQSEGDAGLCKLLWFWSGDRETVQRLFGQSELGQRAKWTERPDYQERTLNLSCDGDVYSATWVRDDLLVAFGDARPKIRLPGNNRLLSDFAAEAATCLNAREVFCLNGRIVTVNDGRVHEVTPQEARSLVEKFFVCYREKPDNGGAYEVYCTMKDDEARGLLASPQFKAGLRQLSRVNRARLPMLRADGRIELLPEGYDPTTKTLTISNVNYPEDTPLEKAVETVNDLLGEFSFADSGRSKAVAVAMMLTLYAAQVLPEGSLRPCFIVTKNAEGAGATTLVMCAVVPVLGAMPCGVKTDEDAETRKALTAAVREARTVIVLDNQKSRLSSAALEAFISSPHWSDRILGENTTFTGPNLATVFATANGCTVSPDMRRRSLFAELHLEAERAEDRQFKRPLDLPTLLQMRQRILTALWVLVRHWDTQGRPLPSRSHSAFPAWAKAVGGIVEAAGFGCCLETAHVAVAADPDGDDMRSLVAVMGEGGKPITFSDLVDLARAQGFFESVIGTTGELKHPERIRMARLLARYDRRLVGDHRFVIEGKGHGRQFRVELASETHTRTLTHTVSPHKGNPLLSKLDQKSVSECASVQPKPVNPPLCPRLPSEVLRELLY